MIGTSGRRSRNSAATSVPKRPCAEMVVQNGDVDAVEQLLGLLDRVGGLRDVAVLAQDGRAQQQVLRMVVQQQDADRFFLHGLGHRASGLDFLNVGHLSLTMRRCRGTLPGLRIQLLYFSAGFRGNRLINSGSL